MSDKPQSAELLSLTTEIVSSHVANNSVAASELPQLIKQVYASLDSASSGEDEKAAERPQPAVPIKRSITPDFIICLEDGMQFKSLKRHLRTSYNLTPDEYREKWGLPYDYPMVAPNYAAARSALAKKSGLGRKGNS